MKLTREEQETVIRRSAADDKWDVWSDDPVWVRKIKRLATRDDVDVIEESESSIRALLPKRFVKASPPRRVSEEQRKASAERLARARRGEA